MTTDTVSAVLARFDQAMAAHDAGALAACFAADYRSEQPVHPARAFTGAARVRENWTEIFADVPDLHAETLRTAIDGDTAWAEIRWSGHKRDGSTFEVCGVRLFGIRDDRIAWGRLYLEPVERSAEDHGAAVRRITRP
jgi:ketosteroid isomerase-like protein